MIAFVKSVLGISGDHKTSKLGLVAANLIILGGVFFLGWNVYDLIYFYWVEAGIIGCLTVIRLASLVRTDASIVLVPVGIALFVVWYLALMLLLLYVIQSIPILTDVVNQGINRVSELPLLYEPLALLKESIRPGLWLAVIGFVFGQGIAFYDRYNHAAGFRSARALGVIGHACQRLLVVLFIVGLGVPMIFFAPEQIWFALIFVFFKLVFDLWENSKSFNPKGVLSTDRIEIQ